MKPSLVPFKIIVVFILSSAKMSHTGMNNFTVPRAEKTIKLGYFYQVMSTPSYRIGAIKLGIDKARAAGLVAGYNIR